VAQTKVQWSLTWARIVILAMLILWGSSQIWYLKRMPFSLDNDRVHDHPLWYWPCWSCEDHPRSDIRRECLAISNTLAVFSYLRSNVGTAHAAQVISRVSEMLISPNATPSWWPHERTGSDKDAMTVCTIIHYDTGHADLVRIILDLRFKVNVFPSWPHWLYFFTLEAMSVSHTQHR